MDQYGELKRSKTLQETMPLMPEYDMMNMQDQARFSFAPVEDQVEQNLDEQIQVNLEEVQVIEEEKLVPPTAEEVKEAHKNLGVKMPSDPVKRSNRLKESKKNFDRSKEFINAQQEFREKQSRSNIANDLVDFKKMAQDKNLLDSLFSKKKGEKADEFLVKNYGEIQQKLSCLDNLTEEDVKGYEAQFKTLQEIRHFYDLQGQLMSNKYYTLIPGEEMQNLSYKELKKELLSEYEKKDRNMELIRYYETLIKLKNCEVKDKKSAKASFDGEQEEKKEEKLNERGTAEHEIEKIADGFAGFEMVENADKLRDGGEKWLHYKVFFDVVEKDIQRYRDSGQPGSQSEKVKNLMLMYDQYKAGLYDKADHDFLEKDVADHMQEDEDLKEETKIKKAGADEAGGGMNKEQKEGLRLVQSWLLRHASENHWYKRKSKVIENSQNALALRVVQMPPQQQLLVFYLMENNITSDGDASHFYSALQGYVPNKKAFTGSVSWDKLSAAVRQTSQSAGYIEEYEKIEASLKKFEENPQDASDNGNDADAQIVKKANLFGEFAAHVSMISLLCQSVGLNKDNNMDPELIEDKKIRQRIVSEQEKVNDVLKKLRDLGVSDKNLEGKEKNKKGNDFRDKEKALMDAIDKYLPKEGSALKRGLAGAGGAAFFGANLAGYAMTMHEGFFGILELGFAIYSAANIRLASPTAAEQAGVALDTIGSLLSGVGNTVAGAANFFTTIATNAGNTALELAGKMAAHAAGETVMTETELASTMAGQATAEATYSAASQAAVPIYYAGGSILMIAGAAKLIGHGVHLHRAKKNIASVNKTEEMLKEKEETHKLTKDERRLRRFCQHRKEGAKEEKRSAGLSMISASMTVISGALITTGVGAPLAIVTMFAGMGIDIANSIVGSKRKGRMRKNAIDTYLQMDKMVEKAKTNPSYLAAEGMKETELRDKLRKEMLAQLGYSSVDECFRDIVVADAKLLYQKAFDDSISENDRKMYEEAIKSLGFKIKRSSKGDRDSENKPTVQMMVAKLMK